MEPSPAPSLTLTPEESPDEAAIRAIASGLDFYNAGFAAGADWSPHWIVGRAPDGAVQAGVKYVISLDWLFVQCLWVAEPYLKFGIGSQLLSGAEAAAREKHCRAAYLGTFTFQARKFCQRHGYREYDRLDDFPAGHSRISLSKPL